MNQEAEYKTKYIAKYKTLLYNCIHNNVGLDEHKQFEIVYTLLWEHLLWDDLPPDFGDIYNLPHTRDYGIDTISPCYTQSGQVKHYGENSCVKWSDFTNFTQLSDCLNITNLHLGTTPHAKLDSYTEMLCMKKEVSIHRNTFEALIDIVLHDFETN